MMENRIKSILIIYTGGTIGMIKNQETGALAPFDFDQILNEAKYLMDNGYQELILLGQNVNSWEDKDNKMRFALEV